MSLIKIQSEAEKRRGIYYQVDSNDKPIGIGGMGQVYKGICVDEHNGSTRQVAIKFMYADLPPQAIERARREAAIQLRNDNLVEMLGFIEIVDRQPTGEISKRYHVVSELLTGVSLADVLEGKTKDRDGNDVPFAMKMLHDFRHDPEHFARTIAIGVLSGLMALHDAGYIHRDIDPSNIMLTTDGHIKLIDFGIAKHMNNLTTNDRSLTVAGAFMGKPEYAAPELVLGDIKHQSQATDIYAVGILLYQCIVGHTPFEGPRHEILENQIHSKLPLRVIKDRGLRKIISTACEKKRELRYQTSAQMRAALEAPPKPGFPDAVKYALMGVAGLLLLIGIIFMVSNMRGSSAEEQSAQQELAEIKAKQQILAQVDSLEAQAKGDWTKGADRETYEDVFENYLMSAYRSYDEALQVGAGYLEEERLASLKKSRDNIRVELEEVVANFAQDIKDGEVMMNVPEVAQAVDMKKKRLANVEEFLKSNP